MWFAAAIARIGNKIMGLIVIGFILLMFFYGAYSLWDTAMLYKGAFVSDELLAFKPSLDEPDTPTLSELVKINSDVCGWITIDDTHIDYPIVRGEDDMEYINKDVYGEFALSGSIFMDSDNQADFSDSYTLLYGHHMDNGAMFGDVVEFVQASYFDTHKSGVLFTSNGEAYSIQLYACVKTNAFDTMIYYPTHQEQGNMTPLLDYIKEMAVQYRDIGMKASDQVVGLSTCDESDTNGRIILFGKVTKIENIQEGGS